MKDLYGWVPSRIRIEGPTQRSVGVECPATTSLRGQNANDTFFSQELHIHKIVILNSKPINR